MTAPQDASQPVLHAKDVRKSFLAGDRKIGVLHGASLELYAGERLCLMGASGAGKSTFLHILGLLEPPDEGCVELHGKDAWRGKNDERAVLRNRHIGFVFQFYHLLPELTGVENVLLPWMITPAKARALRSRKAATDRARELLVSCGLEERLSHKPSQLSGGERQRVAIARALFLEPEILIADEPTGNLDSATGERVLKLLFEQQSERNLALLLVTHDERIAVQCHRTLHMFDGRVGNGSLAEREAAARA